MAGTSEELDRLARLGVGLIDVQLELSSMEAKNALYDIWALGYCFGVFDAIVQKAKLDQYVDGAALITRGFCLLLSDAQVGAEKFSYAMDRQTHPIFVSANKRAGNEIFDWLEDTKRVPMALHAHFSATM